MEITIFVSILLVFLVIALLIAYFVLESVRPSSIISLSPTHGTLNKETQLAPNVDVEATFFRPASSTFMFYAYMFPTERTKALTVNTNFVQTLFAIGNTLQFRIQAPNANSESPKASLRIQYPTARGTEYDEKIFVHPPIQKWTLISIVREGRRFTVFYDKEIVASFRTTNFPNGSVAPLTVGNQNLNGQFAFGQLLPYAISSADIDSYKSKTANSRGEPYLPSETIFSTFRLGCPNGLFCPSTTGVAPNPLKRWATPYA